MVKILAGILYSGEPQFEDCINSVKSQEGVEFDYFVIKNLPKNEAHDLLYKTFMSKADAFDIFVKLDSDMVIQEVSFFNFLEDKFSQNKELDWYHLFIYDFILKENISGLNVYRNNVKWKLNKDNFFTDRGHIDSSIRKREIEMSPAKNWVVHCPSPAPIQVFNFSAHRAIKAFQFGKKERTRNTTHGTILSKMAQNFYQTNDLMYAYAFYGFLDVIKNKRGAGYINKNDQQKLNTLNTLLVKDPNIILKETLSDWRIKIIMKGGKLGYLFLFYLYLIVDRLNSKKELN